MLVELENPLASLGYNSKLQIISVFVGVWVQVKILDSSHWLSSLQRFVSLDMENLVDTSAEWEEQLVQLNHVRIPRFLFDVFIVNTTWRIF